MLSGAESRKNLKHFLSFLTGREITQKKKSFRFKKGNRAFHSILRLFNCWQSIDQQKKKGKLFPTTFPLPPVGYYCDTAGRQPVALEYGWWEAQRRMFGFNILENLFSLYAGLRNWMFSNSTRNLQIRTTAEIHFVLRKI